MPSVFLFFVNDTATTEIYTLSLHDALPICSGATGDVLMSRATDTARFALTPLAYLEGDITFEIGRAHV